LAIIPASIKPRHEGASFGALYIAIDEEFNTFAAIFFLRKDSPSTITSLRSQEL
jgi:hypothetical protein